jgi:dTDP-4-dehydrorhamnose reductase
MKKVLVTGSYGQLGSELQQIASQLNSAGFIFTDADTLDICSKEALEQFVVQQPVDFIVNCAAYTAVDKAEDDEVLCNDINCNAVRNIGEVAASKGIKVIHISTDYVFDGTAHTPYTEDGKINPKTVYGKTKACGEEELMRVCLDAVIIRTSWLYSTSGNNFVKTMLKLGKERDSLSVVFDQIGTPTNAADLAAVILHIIGQTIENESFFRTGVYHFSNEGVCSWYDFTIAIHRFAGIDCKVLPIESSEYPAKTPRPFYSVLNKAKIKRTFGIQIAHWESSLARCVAKLITQQK